MADTKISALTDAGTLDGTEELAVVQSGSTLSATTSQFGLIFTDTVTISSAASGSWSIPDGCVYLKWRIADGSGLGANLNVRLKEASGGASGAFDRSVLRVNVPDVNNNAASTDPLTIIATGTTVFGGFGDVHFPRSSSIKTQCDGQLWVNRDNYTRASSYVAETAEDHDTIAWEAASGTFSCTVFISYVLQL